MRGYLLKTNMKDIEQKIIEIIGSLETWEDYARRNGTSYQNILDMVANYDRTVKKLTKLYAAESKAYLMELIGEDEIWDILKTLENTDNVAMQTTKDIVSVTARNQLREELREKLS